MVALCLAGGGRHHAQKIGVGVHSPSISLDFK
jgi:hypothetical protein